MSYIRQFLRPGKYVYTATQKHLAFSSMSSAQNKSKSDEEVIDLDAPIKFSTSEALKWKAKSSRTGGNSNRLWYEPYVILASVSVFLIYFTYIREENDVDKELVRSLYSRIEGLEEHQLNVALEYNLDRGLSTKPIIDRLNEIKQQQKTE